MTSTSGDSPKPKRVLIVEDNADLRFMLRRVFEGAGYSVDEAANGRFALALAAKIRPDVVLTDIFMPEIEGIETILRLREAAPNAKIVAMSGRPDISDYDVLGSALKLGAHATIAKPFMPRDVLLKVSELLSENVPPKTGIA